MFDFPVGQRLFVSALVVLGLAVAHPGAARANLDIQTGIKWTPISYTTPVGAGSEKNASPATAAVPGQQYNSDTGVLYGWQNALLGSYLAFFFHERIGVQLTLDFGYSGHSNATTNAGSFDTSYFQPLFLFGHLCGGGGAFCPDSIASGLGVGQDVFSSKIRSNQERHL